MRKKYVWNPGTCICENIQEVLWIIQICDEVMESQDQEIKTIPTILMK